MYNIFYIYIVKYLTQYRLFESDNYDDIKKTLKEILLPISDMDYDVDVYLIDYTRFGVTEQELIQPKTKVADILSFSTRIDKDYIGKENNITIRLSKYGNPLFVNPYMDHVVRNCVGLKMDDEVKEEFNRMKDYLESEGFNSIMVYFVAKIGKYNAGYKLDFNEFIMNDFELSQLIFIAKS